jgi:PIN domain nuclease of toxin-antitoxin system
VRLLLDTHVFLWIAADPANLSPVALDAIANRSNRTYVSVATAWEIVIKTQSGKLRLPTDPSSYVPSRIAALGFASLPITQDHALAISSLPPTHKDPFDRIMIAQAQIEGLTLVTRDAASLTYPVQTLKA